MENDKLVFKGENSQALTNSLLVAEKFGKTHDNVLKAIRNIVGGGVVKNDETPMFVESTYFNQQNGQDYPLFVMNRDGFTLLAMGFTGKKALQFKLDYIAAFNAMENELRKPKSLSQLEILQGSVNALIEHDKRLQAVEQRLDNMDKEREGNGRLLLEAKLSDIPTPQQSVRYVHVSTNLFVSMHVQRTPLIVMSGIRYTRS